MMKPFRQIFLAFFLLSAISLWSQVDTTSRQPVPAYGMSDIPDDSDTRMLTPPPVGGQPYPQLPTSQEQSNYLRGDVTFSSAYSDNALGATGSEVAPVSDASYSIWPTVSIDKISSRLHWSGTYAPGFTFYQHTSSRNQADQNASINFQYRLSPHVTFSARDRFQKSSSVFNQPDFNAAGIVSGGIQEPNLSLIAPLASQLTNFGNVGITYQFAANSMIGFSGTFANLHYLDPAEVQGLYDSSSQGGSAFYAFRFTKMHYIGVSYQHQRLLSYPVTGTNDTQTQALVLYYTLYVTPQCSISFFGGPQYAEIGPQFSTTASSPSPGSRTWHAEGGGSFSWQGRMSSMAISYSHMISSGGGLIEAAKTDNASASIVRQFSRSLRGSVTGGYVQNDIVALTSPIGSNGHTILGTALLQRQLGEHLEVAVGYTRLHQGYGTIGVLSTNPNTNRESVSISYQFSRPLGR